MEFEITNVYGYDDFNKYQDILSQYHYNLERSTIILNTLQEFMELQEKIDYPLILEGDTIEIYDHFRE